MLVVALPFISFACRNEMNIFGPQCFKLQHRDRYNSQNFRDVRRENVKKENAAGIKVCISWLDAIEKHWRVFFFFFKCPSAWVRMMFSSAWINFMYFSQKKNPQKWYLSFVVHHIKGLCCLLILLMMASTKHSMGYWNSKRTLMEN